MVEGGEPFKINDLSLVILRFQSFYFDSLLTWEDMNPFDILSFELSVKNLQLLSKYY